VILTITQFEATDRLDLEGSSLIRFALLSIAAAALTIGLKTTAWWITALVGLKG
jgi:hypothetical protein